MQAKRERPAADPQGSAPPPKELQREFWDGWNAAHRLKDPDVYMSRQRDVACALAARMPRGRILEVGCGTGWLCGALAPFGDVTGIDLSPASIAQAKARYPGLTFIEGDIESIELDAFDFVVSADVISHVADQQRFVERIAKWTRPGGTFLLMTQNPFVWRRSSYLAPQAAGQIRNWPSLHRVRALLAPFFTIRSTTSIVPGGDRGILRALNGRVGGGMVRKLLGEANVTALYERAFIGREMVIVAERRTTPDRVV